MREKIEHAFWHWGHLCARFPWLMIALSVLLTDRQGRSTKAGN